MSIDVSRATCTIANGVATCTVHGTGFNWLHELFLPGVPTLVGALIGGIVTVKVSMFALTRQERQRRAADEEAARVRRREDVEERSRLAVDDYLQIAYDLNQAIPNFKYVLPYRSSRPNQQIRDAAMSALDVLDEMKHFALTKAHRVTDNELRLRFDRLNQLASDLTQVNTTAAGVERANLDVAHYLKWVCYSAKQYLAGMPLPPPEPVLPVLHRQDGAAWNPMYTMPEDA